MHNTGYLDTVTTALADAADRNETAIGEAAEVVLSVVRADGLVFAGGAGHSLAAVTETFYRAGGLAPVYPLYHPDLLPLHGAQTSTVAERTAGLGERVLTDAGAADDADDDVLVVFSNSGINPYPVELASTARAAGIPVIAVNSRRAAAAAPSRAGSTLAEHATVLLDTAVVPGELSYPAADPRTGAQSTILNAFLWNLVLAAVADRAAAAGVELPLWRSSNVAGGDKANAALLRRLRVRIPALR